VSQCPTCVRFGHSCEYCRLLCQRMAPCDCSCHEADIKREAEINAERIARIK